MKKRANAAIAPGAAVLVSIVAIVVATGAYLTFVQGGVPATSQTTSTTSTTSGSSGIKGVVTGYVTVGPSQPVCYANQTCNVNMTGYSLVFRPQCSSSNCQSEMATLSPSGHYSIFLPAGNYTVIGLSPDCKWMGCASAFPKTVTVEAGMQLVFNVDIDTGIR